MTHKLAVSAGRTMSLLRARGAQGARIGPQAMGHAAAVPAAAQTPAAMRNLALNAGGDVRAARQAQTFSQHPIPTARRQAAGQVMELEHTKPETMFDFTATIGSHGEVPRHSPQKADMLFGTQSRLHDPGTLGTHPVGFGTDNTVLASPPPRPRTREQIAESLASPPTKYDIPQDIIAQHAAASHTAVPLRAQGGSLDVTPRPQRLRPRPPAPEQPKLAAALWGLPEPITRVTHNDGKTEVTPSNPVDQVSGAWNESDRLTAEEPASSEKTAKAHKLQGRMTFRGLPISIETAKGGYRHWVDAATGEKGKTRMRYAYGYIRRTEGLDGDHVDVFVGPNEQAKNVYVVMTNKAPDFKERDEEKCMLGFDSVGDAKAAFMAHYNKSGFFHSITAIPYAEFEKRVFATFDGKRKKVAEDAAFEAPTTIFEQERGLPRPGPTRHILGQPKSREDRISAQFGYHDLDQDTTATEGAWGSPPGSILQ